jgi:hypothetical protein
MNINLIRFAQDLQGTIAEGGRHSTVDLLIKIGCFVKKEKNTVSV